MRKIILFLFFSVTAVQAATPLNKDYVNHLGLIYEAINNVQFTNDICRELAPATSKSNDAALNQWKVRHQPFLEEYNRRYSAYIRGLANKNPQQYAIYIKIMNGKFAQKKVVRRAELQKLSSANRLALCQRYPEALEANLSPEKLLYKEIRLTRQSMPVF